MADKRLDQLETVNLLKTGDYIPVYDSLEAGDEKLKKMSPHHFKFYQGDPYSTAGISLVLYNGLAINFTVPGPSCRLSVADVLISIKGGVPPFTYSIKLAAGAYVDNTDPYQAYLTFACEDNGIQSIYIKVTDFNSVVGECDTYVSVVDTMSFCLA